MAELDAVYETRLLTEDRSVSVAERITCQLREEIVNGRLVPGTQLIEVELSAKYSASRNSVREALQRLRSEGLSTSIRHRGVFVRCFTPDDVRDIYTARRTLELRAISCGPSPTDAHLALMNDTVRGAEQALAAEQWRQVGTLSLQFHQQIVTFLGSPLLDQFFYTLCAQLRLVFTSHPDESQIQTSDWVRREKRILQALEQKDRERASVELIEYLDLSEEILLDVVRRFGQ